MTASVTLPSIQYGKGFGIEEPLDVIDADRFDRWTKDRPAGVEWRSKVNSYTCPRGEMYGPRRHKHTPASESPSRFEKRLARR